jgi:3-phosphoshikimate 1-carboxyvinyltransferase
VALAAYAKGETILVGANRLLHKESNRAQTLMQEFAKMGVAILHDEDRLIVKGTGSVQGAAVAACGDHRIAMALAVAALAASGSTEISGAEAIKKSYPAFFADLSSLGASVSLPNFN